MSSTYRAGQVPDDPKALVGFLRMELAKLEQALNAAQGSIELVVLHAEPERLRAGMTVYADGTDWNPGSGAGVYRRSEANDAWVHLG